MAISVEPLWLPTPKAIDVLHLSRHGMGRITCAAETREGPRCERDVEWNRLLQAMDLMNILATFASKWNTASTSDLEIAKLRTCLVDLARLMSCQRHSRDAGRTARTWNIEFLIDVCKKVADHELYDVLRTHMCPPLIRPDNPYRVKWPDGRISNTCQVAAEYRSKRLPHDLESYLGLIQCATEGRQKPCQDSERRDYWKESHSASPPGLSGSQHRCWNLPRIQTSQAVKSYSPFQPCVDSTQDSISIWQTSWARYEKQWSGIEELPSDCTKDDLSSTLPWPVKDGQRRRDSVLKFGAFFQADVAEFLLNEPGGVAKDPLLFRNRLRSETLRWHPARIVQRFPGVEDGDEFLEMARSVMQVVDRLICSV